MQLVGTSGAALTLHTKGRARRTFLVGWDLAPAGDFEAEIVTERRADGSFRLVSFRQRRRDGLERRRA